MNFKFYGCTSQVNQEKLMYLKHRYILLQDTVSVFRTALKEAGIDKERVIYPENVQAALCMVNEFVDVQNAVNRGTVDTSSESFLPDDKFQSMFSAFTTVVNFLKGEVDIRPVHEESAPAPQKQEMVAEVIDAPELINASVLVAEPEVLEVSDEVINSLEQAFINSPDSEAPQLNCIQKGEVDLQILREFVLKHQPCTLEYIAMNVFKLTTVTKSDEKKIGFQLNKSGCTKTQRRINKVKSIYWIVDSRKGIVDE